MTKPLGCPRCGGVTQVRDTRPNPTGTRRRRVCIKPDCDGAITTIEVVHTGKWPRIDQRLVLVPLVELEALIALARTLLPEGP